MIQINLLPDIKVVYLKIRRLRMIVFLASLFIVTVCTIFLLALGGTTLVQQKDTIETFEKNINAYVREFNSGSEGDNTREHLDIQRKFEALATLEEGKIDAYRVWTNGLFGGNRDLKINSFLPSVYLQNIELYDFNFETGEFTVTGTVGGSGQGVNMRDYFKFAYYEIAELDDKGEITGWSCPLAAGGRPDGSPDWTFCKMFSDVTLGEDDNTDLEAPRRVTISGLFTVVVPGSGINLFDEDVIMRVSVPSGCSDIACITRPEVGDNEPQDFVSNNQDEN